MVCAQRFKDLILDFSSPTFIGARWQVRGILSILSDRHNVFISEIKLEEETLMNGLRFRENETTHHSQTLWDHVTDPVL